LATVRARGERRLAGLLALLFLAAAPPLVSAGPAPGEGPPELLSYRVTEHAPIIKGRHDKAFRRALEAAFRKAVLTALRDIGRPGDTGQDFAGWQAGIFSRAGDFIASYRIISQEEKEGYLTLAVRAEVYRNKLQRAVSEAAVLAPALSSRVLVLVDNFPLSGTSGFEDIDAGNLAARALETELLRRGLIILPSPESLPWQHLGERATAENKLSLAAAEGRRAGADYVALGHLQARADKLLTFTVELLSSSSTKTLSTARSPVELQADTLPGDSFVAPAGEIAGMLLPRIGAGSRRSAPERVGP
jgi:hypothetical protein